MSIATNFEAALEFCGLREMAGSGIAQDDLVNYSNRETTPDQRDIEEALAIAPIAGQRLLHVGIGNSSLARRLSFRLAWIEGVSVSQQEKAHALKLAIPNYRVEVFSKYGLDLARRGLQPFDLIVDNNLASYACCRYHFRLMLDTYASLLRPGGRLYTHKLGMDWVVENPLWRLSDDDLVTLATKFGLGAVTRDGGVRILSRGDAAIWTVP